MLNLSFPLAHLVGDHYQNNPLHSSDVGALVRDDLTEIVGVYESVTRGLTNHHLNQTKNTTPQTRIIHVNTLIPEFQNPDVLFNGSANSVTENEPQSQIPYISMLKKSFIPLITTWII
jgi:hypothetical protein